MDIDIGCKSISILSDIGEVIFSTEKSKSRMPKKFCSSMSPTAIRKCNLSKQNMAVLIKNALKIINVISYICYKCLGSYIK